MSNANTVDDLLSFKEYEPDNYSRGSSSMAEININSPKRDFSVNFDDLADEVGQSGSSGRQMQQQQPEATGGKRSVYFGIRLRVDVGGRLTKSLAQPI